MNNQIEDTITLACIGDSLTEGENGYPSHLQKMLGSQYKVFNFGIGGCTMLKKGDKPYWENDVYKHILKSNPDIIIMMLGTNDTKPHNWKHKSEFKKNYIEMIEALRSLSSKPKFYIVLPVPVFKTNFGISNEILLEVHTLLREIVSEQNLPLIDAYTPLLSSAKHFSDGVHPDTTASEAIAKVIYPTLLHTTSS